MHTTTKILFIFVIEILSYNLNSVSLKKKQESLFEKICVLPPPPAGSPGDSKQLLIANIDYDEFKGKMGIGRLTAGI
jgi:predicted membrane GTPase involved in stress response